MAQNHPGELVAVRYHGWWPGPNDPFYVYNSSENGARISYYSQNAVPNLHIDGLIDAGSQEQQWWTQIQTRIPVSSPLKISLGGSFSEISREGILNIDVTATEIITQLNLRVRIALTESEIHFNAPNGVQLHNQTMRDIIPYPYGIPIDIEFGDSIALVQSFNCPEPIVPANSNLVVWIQSDATAEVLQAAGVSLDELAATGIGEESSEIPDRPFLEQNYPNPFNANTTISYYLPHPQSVKLEIYDIGGRLVKTLVNDVKDRGVHKISFDSSKLAGGIYLYRLNVGEAKIVRKMSLLK